MLLLHVVGLLCDLPTQMMQIQTHTKFTYQILP
jgi:hypothetical protein